MNKLACYDFIVYLLIVYTIFALEKYKFLKKVLIADN